MLGKYFPGLFGDDSELATNLRVGDATRIEGDIAAQIRTRYSLQPYASAEQVLDEAELASKLKAAQYLHTKFSRHRLKQLQSFSKIYQNQLTYSQEAMKVEDELQRAKAMHGESVVRHAFGSAEQHRQLSGYEQAFESVSDSFRF